MFNVNITNVLIMLNYILEYRSILNRVCSMEENNLNAQCVYNKCYWSSCIQNITVLQIIHAPGASSWSWTSCSRSTFSSQNLTRDNCNVA